MVVLLMSSIFFSVSNNYLNDSDSNMSEVNYFDKNINISAVTPSILYLPACKCTNDAIHS